MPPENGSAALIFLNLSDGFSVNPVLVFSFVSSSYPVVFIWLSLFVEAFLKGFGASYNLLEAKGALLTNLFSFLKGGFDIAFLSI